MRYDDWISRLNAERIIKEKTKLEEEDFYWQEGKMVFTKEYHLKRGHCCGNGCKNCPFDNNLNKNEEL
jgi:hypothetical protein